jgi:acyl-homoserine lactone acylase PvdQ
MPDLQRIDPLVQQPQPIVDGALPRPGWDGAAGWDGFLPFEAKPHIESPASGMIVNANNRVVPADHPVFLGRDWYGDWRFRRIGAGLAAQAQQLFTAARAMGQGGADDGFVIRVWQALTGIELPGDEKKS